MITKIVLISTVAIWILYDIWVWKARGINETISVHVYTATKKHPVIAFLAGGLCAHFWFPMVIEVCNK